jgi:Tfp pilus assembly protein PilX
VRNQVTQVLEYVTWHTSLLLTIVIVNTWKIMCQIYQATQQHTSNGANTENEARSISAMAVMIAMESSEVRRTNTAHFDTDATTIGVDNR